MNHVLVMRGRSLTALVAVGFTMGCSERATPVERTVELSPQCSGQVEVAVATSPAPQMSWTPNCGIDRLMVEELAEPGNLYGITWGLVSAGTRIFPGVTYGTAPAGTSPLGPGSALVADREYRVRLLQSTSSGDVLLGQATFIP